MVTKEASNIKSFPNELLEKIFGYIKNKAEIRLVCKPWYLVAGIITSFAYHEDDVFNFGQALRDCQGLREQVRCLRVNPHRLHTSGSSNMFMSMIFPSCPNLVELILDINPSNFTYLQKLCNTYCRRATTYPLPILQRLDVSCMNHHWYHVELLKNFRDSLAEMNVEVDFLVMNVYERDVFNFISSFKCLKNLSLNYKNYTSGNLDMTAFPSLFANDIGLEGLKVSGNAEYRFAATNLEKLCDEAPTNNLLKNWSSMSNA